MSRPLSTASKSAESGLDSGRTTALVFASTSGLTLAADLLTKWITFQDFPFQAFNAAPTAAARRLIAGPVHTVIPGLLDIHTVMNEGAAFSLGRGLSWLFIMFTIIVAPVILWTVWTYGRGSRVLTVALGLVLGGAFGNNLVDRLVYGGRVRDFIDLHAGNYHWPIFNIADTAICVGCGLIILYSFLAPGKKSAQASSRKS